MTTLLVVIPIKDERDNLRPLHDRLRQALEPLRTGQASPALADYELLFIDDGSNDGSFAVLEELAASDPRVKVVKMRRNFGQTPALRAGIDWSSGDVLVTMDGDLQNDPLTSRCWWASCSRTATTPCSACARRGRTTCWCASCRVGRATG